MKYRTNPIIVFDYSYIINNRKIEYLFRNTIVYLLSKPQFNMCLSIVARIEKIQDDDRAIVELGKVRKTIHLGLLVGEVEINDYVLVHTGFAIAKIDEEKALKIIENYVHYEDLIY